MAMSVGGPRKGAIAEINVTPMADVMIVLLIIFMVATPIIASAPVRLPLAASARETGEERIEIVVRSDGSLAIGGEPLAAQALGELLAAGPPVARRQRAGAGRPRRCVLRRRPGARRLPQRRHRRRGARRPATAALIGAGASRARTAPATELRSEAGLTPAKRSGGVRGGTRRSSQKGHELRSEAGFTPAKRSGG